MLIERQKDVCVIMNTGGGKSLIYEMASLLTAKTIIVVEPLIAIINDQKRRIDSARGGKVRVVGLTPDNKQVETDMAAAKAGEIGICILLF